MQSYGKTREERKKSLFFFPIPSASNFGNSQSYGNFTLSPNNKLDICRNYLIADLIRDLTESIIPFPS